MVAGFVREPLQNAESKADITTIYRHIPTLFSDVSLPH